MDPRTSRQIDEDIDEYKAMMKTLFLQEQNNQLNLKRKYPVTKWFFKIFFKNADIVFKSDIYVSDFKRLESSDPLSFDNIINEIRLFVNNQLQKRKHFKGKQRIGESSKPPSQNPSENLNWEYVFCNYYTICKYLVKSISCKSQILFLARALLDVILFGSFIGYIYASIVGMDILWVPFTLLMGFLILHLVRNITNLYLLKLQELSKMKLEQTMRVLVFHKMIKSDTYFLTHTDNNIIYKVFYKDFELFTEYNFNLIPAIPLLVFDLGLVTLSLAFKNSLFLILISLMLVQQTLIVATTWLKCLEQSDLNRVSFQQRKATYEVIYNFRSIRSRNLLKYCADKLDRINATKIRLYQKIYRWKLFRHALYKYFFPCCYLIYNVIPLLFLAEATDESIPEDVRRELALSKWSPNSVETIYLLFALVLMEDYLKEVVAGLETWIGHRKSKELFDKFFDNDLIFNTFDNQKIEGCLAGEIKVESAEIFERENKSLNEIIGYMMASEERTQNTVTGLDGNSRATFQSNLSQTLRRSMTPVISGEKSSFGFSKNLITTRLKRVFSNINLNIPQGSKVCIYHENSDLVKSFFKMITGDYILRSGKVSISGKKAYFNPHHFSFMVGSTIRDNIICGSEYNEDKYTSILKNLNLNFDGYFGRDRHQITERADNICNEDLKMILLARMLYTDSDIYIIQDYLNETLSLLNVSLVQLLFSSYFVGKTVIYNTRLYHFIDMSTMIIQIESKNRVWTYSTEAFRTKFNETTKTAFNNQIEDGKKLLLRNKIKNSMFLATTGFEEELIIYKKQQAHQKEITTFKEKTKNYLEQIVYGVKLVQEKIKEGTNIEPLKRPNQLPDSLLSNLLLYVLNQVGLKRSKLFLAASILSPIIYLYYEATIVYPISKSMRSHPGKIFSARGTLHTTFAALAYIAIDFYKVKKSYNHFSRYLTKQYSVLLQGLLNSEVQSLQKSYYHTTLDRLCADLNTAHKSLGSDCIDVNDSMAGLTAATLLISVEYSFVVPMLIMGGISLLTFGFQRRVHLGYQRIISLLDENNYKLKALNYQLLNLISTHRVMGVLDSLTRKFRILSNNITSIKQTCILDLQANTFLTTCLVNFLVLAPLLVFSVFKDSIPYISFMSSDNYLFGWPILIIYRMYVNLRQMHISLFRLDDKRNLFVRISDYAESVNETMQMNSSWLSLRNMDFQIGAPIIFRNVSLTLGYKPILKKVTLKIEAYSRLGIVGADGIGRSSLFHLLTGVKKKDENPSVKSVLRVFGVDAEKLNISHLSKMYFIETKPNLLEGSIRNNIDPFHKSTDSEIMSVVEEFGFDCIDKLETEEDADFIRLEDMVDGDEQDYNLISDRVLVPIKEYGHSKTVPVSENSKQIHGGSKISFQPMFKIAKLPAEKLNSSKKLFSTVQIYEKSKSKAGDVSRIDILKSPKEVSDGKSSNKRLDKQQSRKESESNFNDNQSPKEKLLAGKKQPQQKNSNPSYFSSENIKEEKVPKRASVQITSAHSRLLFIRRCDS